MNILYIFTFVKKSSPQKANQELPHELGAKYATSAAYEFPTLAQRFGRGGEWRVRCWFSHLGFIYFYLINFS